MYVCMYVCVYIYVCMYVCINMYLYIYMYVYTYAGTQLVKPLSLEEYSLTPPLMRAGRHPTRDRLRGEPGLAKKGDQKMGLLELCCFEKRVVIHNIYIYVCVCEYVCMCVRT